METLVVLKLRESIVGGRFPTVALVFALAVPPEVSVVVIVQDISSLGEALFSSMVRLLPVDRVAPVV